MYEKGFAIFVLKILSGEQPCLLYSKLYDLEQ